MDVQGCNQQYPRITWVNYSDWNDGQDSDNYPQMAEVFLKIYHDLSRQWMFPFQNIPFLLSLA